MTEHRPYAIALTERDLDFIVQTISPENKNKNQLKRFIESDSDFRKSALADENLFRKIINNNHLFLEISPLLFFEVLLRGTIKELSEATHTVERTISLRIPVFDVKETLEFLTKEEVFDYLTYLLTSFASKRKKKTASDVDIDNLIKLGKKSVGPMRFSIYKRIADVCLFILGIFPEYLAYDYYYLFFDKKPPIKGGPIRSIADYETLGQEFYSLAAKQDIAKEKGWEEALLLLSENFYLAKKPLNFVSEHYLAINAV